MDRWLNKIPARKPQLKIMLKMQMQVNKKRSGQIPLIIKTQVVFYEEETTENPVRRNENYRLQFSCPAFRQGQDRRTSSLPKHTAHQGVGYQSSLPWGPPPLLGFVASEGGGGDCQEVNPLLTLDSCHMTHLYARTHTPLVLQRMGKGAVGMVAAGNST